MKTKNTLALALLTIFALSAVTSIPLINMGAQAADPAKMKTYSLVDAIPNKIGLGETTLLKTGITQALNAAEDGWIDLTIIVTKPDGTNQTLGTYRSDSTGSTFAQYTPDAVGNYTITSIFPEQPMPVNTSDAERGVMILKGTIMLASSASCTLEVTSEPSPQYPGHSLPTEYWSRPIDNQLREWWSISGNWVGRPDNSLALYNSDAPETAHVLWAQDLTTGGMSGGLMGPGQVTAGMNSGDAYEGKFSNSVILNGKLYYNTGPAPGFYGSLGECDVKAVDLHTGEDLWVKEDTYLAFGQEFYWNSYNVDGVYSYLWTTSTTYGPTGPSTTWTAYDPFDFSYCFTFENVPSGTQVYGPSGEILIYQIDLQHNWLALWNSTRAGLSRITDPNSPNLGSWASNVMMQTFDASTPNCYSWNVTIPKGLQQSTSFMASIAKVYNEDRYVSIFFNQSGVNVWALPLNSITPNPMGKAAAPQSIQAIYNKWWKAPSEWLDGLNTLHYTGASNEVEGGVIAVWDKELTTHYGFSVETGEYLWATESEIYLDAYGWGNAEHTWYFAYGKLYSVGVGGILYAYDLETGETEWTYNLADLYGEPVTGQNWWGWITLIADDKIYIGTCEHSAENPLPRGAPQACINASNGAEIWRVNGMFRNTRWGGNGVIGDSIIATMDTYDQRIYAIGKGSTQTTLAASPKVTVEGSSILVEGNVMDKSPGYSTAAMQTRFPSGIAAVSDDGMSQWMLYVWKQFERPTNVTGVPVTISVIDGNGNYRTIGSTTSDATGYFTYDWVPDITGKYTVIATFEGSKAYYGSFAESAFVVDPAAATATPLPTPVPSMADLYFLPATIGIIIAILVVGVILALLLLKKHP